MIKLKAYDPTRKQFFTCVKWVEWRVSSDGVVSAWNYDYDGKKQDLNVVRQTGRFDELGADICEGDIIAVNYHNAITDQHASDVCQVKYHDDLCAFMLDSNYVQYSFEEVETRQLKIIGNIYQNPELME